MQKIKLLFPVLLFGLLSACGDKDEDKTKPPESAEKLYNEAYDQLEDHKYKDAVKSFEEVERQHPSSPWATNAQVMSGFISYETQDYDTAVSTLERFTKLYPNNESTPYAYYLIALCYYEQISDVGRDQKVTEQAMQALREVIRRFPDTEYARDARVKLDLTQDHLAGKEMEIGRYYLRHEDIVAAINRFRFVVDSYQTTSHVPEALHRLVECYLKLGAKDEAQRYAAVLGANFPGSVWYRDSYKLMTGELPKNGDDTSWWDKITGDTAKHTDDVPAASDAADTAAKNAGSALARDGAPGPAPKNTGETSWWDSITPW